MNLNQVTVTMPDLDEGWTFYCALGLVPVVDARPDYVRFVCPDGNSTFSLHKGGDVSAGTTVYFECDDLPLQESRSRPLRRTRVGFGEKLNFLILVEIVSYCT